MAVEEGHVFQPANNLFDARGAARHAHHKADIPKWWPMIKGAPASNPESNAPKSNWAPPSQGRAPGLTKLVIGGQIRTGTPDATRYPAAYLLRPLRAEPWALNPCGGELVEQCTSAAVKPADTGDNQSRPASPFCRSPVVAAAKRHQPVSARAMPVDAALNAATSNRQSVSAAVQGTTSSGAHICQRVTRAVNVPDLLFPGHGRNPAVQNHSSLPQIWRADRAASWLAQGGGL